MRNVALPDPIYDEAAARAAAAGQSLEAFVIDALMDRLAEEEYAPLTPEQIEIVARAEAEIDAGHFYTPEQIREHFVRRKALRAESATG